jgi:hypothetical protein
MSPASLLFKKLNDKQLHLNLGYGLRLLPWSSYRLRFHQEVAMLPAVAEVRISIASTSIRIPQLRLAISIVSPLDMAMCFD